jgi:serine protease Do
MTNNWKSLALVGVLSAATTLGAYKLLDLDKKEVVFNESAPSAFTKLASNIEGMPAAVPTDFTFAAEKTVHSVVHIKSKMTQKAVSRNRQPDIFDFFGDDFGGLNRRGGGQPQEASGSGVIISADGIIVTNNHVVADSDELEVILDDKRSYKAKVIATDPNTDIAVIQIKAENLPFLTFANSDEIRVGEWVLAVGNPFNLESTVTAGIISAKGRSIGILNESRNANPNASPLESFIQTDAAVNPGNSGGALVNLKGELIGINTAIASTTGAFAGYSFAVPTSIVKKVTGDLLKYGNVQRGYLGVYMEELDSKKVEELDLKVSQGVYIKGFSDASSAAKTSGLKIGDVITKIDGADIKSSSKLQEMVARHRPGESVSVVAVDKDGKAKTVNVVLKNLSGTNGIVKADANTEVKIEDLGAKIGNLSSAEKSKLGLKGGAKIISLDENGRLAENGIEEGFVITKIDEDPITNANDFAEKMNGRKGRIRIEGTYPQEPGSRYYYQFNNR